jgi:hypothetical protein
MLTSKPNGKLSGSKADTSTIGSIRLNLIARKMTAIDQPQPNLHPDAMQIVPLQHQRVPTPKRIKNARPSLSFRRNLARIIWNMMIGA